MMAGERRIAGNNPPAARRVLGRFGRYILVDRLGAGGMAEVFRALVLGPEQFQRVVVVKRILPQFSASPSFIEMFIDEARLCGRLSHPNIIQVHEFGNQDGQHFIAMEYVDGSSLGHILQRLADRNTLMPAPMAAEIVRQICRGLAYAHALPAEDGKPLGIVHRDLSPGNLIVGYNGAVKVLDFGIARVENRFRKGMTDPGCVKGKSSYLAPEQVTGQAVDHRADIFTAGIVLYEMLTGTRLFRGDNSTDSMKMVRSMHVPPPSQRNPAVPVRLDAIVLRALRRQREERYQEATEMADALEGFLLENRVSSQELPAFMRSLYGPEIADERIRFTRDEIQAFLGQLPPENASLGSLNTGYTSSPDPVVEVEIEPTPPPPRRRVGTLLLAGGVAAAAALVIAFSPGISRAPPAIPVAAAPVAQARPEARPPTRPPTAAATVTISIDSRPSGAAVYEGSSAARLGETPLQLVRMRGSAPLAFRLKKPSYQTEKLNIVPDADKPAVAILTRDSGRRPRAAREKVRNALPIDPFAE
jgi:eukaryotic-like serine/threonine-protein kinase